MSLDLNKIDFKALISPGIAVFGVGFLLVSAFNSLGVYNEADWWPSLAYRMSNGQILYKDITLHSAPGYPALIWLGSPLGVNGSIRFAGVCASTLAAAGTSMFVGLTGLGEVARKQRGLQRLCFYIALFLWGGVTAIVLLENFMRHADYHTAYIGLALIASSLYAKEAQESIDRIITSRLLMAIVASAWAILMRPVDGVIWLTLLMGCLVTTKRLHARQALVLGGGVAVVCVATMEGLAATGFTSGTFAVIGSLLSSSSGKTNDGVFQFAALATKGLFKNGLSELASYGYLLWGLVASLTFAVAVYYLARLRSKSSLIVLVIFWSIALSRFLGPKVLLAAMYPRQFTMLFAALFTVLCVKYIRGSHAYRKDYEATARDRLTARFLEIGSLSASGVLTTGSYGNVTISLGVLLIPLLLFETADALDTAITKEGTLLLSRKDIYRVATGLCGLCFLSISAVNLSKALRRVELPIMAWWGTNESSYEAKIKGLLKGERGKSGLLDETKTLIPIGMMSPEFKTEQEQVCKLLSEISKSFVSGSSAGGLTVLSVPHPIPGTICSKVQTLPSINRYPLALYYDVTGRESRELVRKDLRKRSFDALIIYDIRYAIDSHQQHYPNNISEFYSMLTERSLGNFGYTLHGRVYGKQGTYMIYARIGSGTSPKR